MAGKRVAVLMGKNVFMAGVVALLREHPGLEVRDIVWDDDDPMHRLSTFDPEAVVLDIGDTFPASRCPLGPLLQNHPDCTVVTLALLESQIQVYRQRRVAEASAADLLGVIAGGVMTRDTTAPRSDSGGDAIGRCS